MPARYETLGNLVNTCLDPDAEFSAMVQAIELDPAILAGFLSFRSAGKSSLKHWHQDIDPAFLPALGIAMAQHYLSNPPESDDARGRLLGWRHATLHSLLAAQMAMNVDAVDYDDARLAGLLASLGNSLLAMSHNTVKAPLDTMVQRSAHDKAGLTAQLLGSWGCEPHFCDAIRYQHVALSQLADTSALIRVVAVAGRLIEFVEGPELLKHDLALEIDALLGLDEDTLYELIGRVSNRFDETLVNLGLMEAFGTESKAIPYPAMPQIESRGWCQFKQNVSEATLAAVFHNALTRAGNHIPFDTLIQDTGRFLFSFNAVVHLAPEQEHLRGAIGMERIAITIGSPDSFIARCFRERKNGVISAEDAGSIVDRQLLDRTRSEALQCVFLSESTGILACGVDSASDTRDRGYLLTNYADAIAEICSRRQAVRGLNPETINARLRELVHEANNPLSIVQNYLRTLSIKLGENDSAQRDITTIGDEIMRASEIIRKFTRVELEPDTGTTEINVNDLVPNLINIFKGGDGGITFNVDLDPRMPATVIPVDNLRQILVNLIKNAQEALHADDRILDRGKQITVTTCGAINLGGRNFVEISVADNGPGIPPQIRDQLFRAHKSLKGGTHEGLGLSIARQLAEDMGGMITCRSRVQEEGTPGTTFQVLVPQVDTRGE